MSKEMIKKVVKTFYQIKENGEILPLQYDNLELVEALIEKRLEQGSQVTLVESKETIYLKPLSMKSIEAYLLDPLFESRDFKDGAKAKKWWNNHFKKASCLHVTELKAWALDTKFYLDDFADEKYYLREEVEHLLNSIVARLNEG